LKKPGWTAYFLFVYIYDLMFERPALGTGVELLCEHVESEFAIYLCLLCLYLMPCSLFPGQVQLEDLKCLSGRKHLSSTRDGTVCGTMDRVGWTVRSREIYNTIQPYIIVALIAKALELQSVTFQIAIYASVRGQV
jgi:hypothetical protein